MILNPYFWLALAVICGVCYTAGCMQQQKETYKVRAEWVADKKARLAEVARIEQERKDADAKAAADAAKDAAYRDLAFDTLKKRHDALAANIGACNRDRALLNSLRDTVSSANAAVARTPSEAAPHTPTTPVASGIDQWFVDVAKLYDDCVAEVIDWNHWYDGLKASR